MFNVWLGTYKSACTYPEGYIWVPFLDPDDIEIFKSGGHLELGKGTGLSWADVKIIGHKRTVHKAWVYREHTGSNPMYINQSIHPSVNQGYRQILRICISYCFSGAGIAQSG
jgi:hypothetical protein